MNKHIQVFTTTGKKEDAERIAKILLEKKLAGCIQIIGPMSSLYWWKGRMEESEEWLCIIKSEKSLYNELEKTIKDNHPYDVPEIIAVPITMGNQDYLDWLNSILELKTKKVRV
jgi:periplasmic divalent cation tolerance protein